MKERVTVTVDADLLAATKRLAYRSQKSVSSVMEEALRTRVSPPKQSFVEKWSGAFSEAQIRDDPTDARLQYLKKKYLKTRE